MRKIDISEKEQLYLIFSFKRIYKQTDKVEKLFLISEIMKRKQDFR